LPERIYPATQPAGTSPDPTATAHNRPGQPRVVDIQKTEGVRVTSGLPIPPLSAVVFRVPLE
jgi:hypothetical protein